MNRQQRKEYDNFMLKNYKLTVDALTESSETTSTTRCIEGALGEVTNNLGIEYQVVLRLVPKSERWMNESEINTVDVVAQFNVER